MGAALRLKPRLTGRWPGAHRHGALRVGP